MRNFSLPSPLKHLTNWLVEPKWSVASPVFLRNLDSEHYFENFLIAAFVSIFSIRFFLKITGYPQLGSGDFHIAHALWGGLLMLIALVMMMIFINVAAKSVAAVVGGVGFGSFLDELGKFITADNDYFYQPTFAIIYLVFILLYLFFLFFIKNSRYTSTEYLANAIELIKDVSINDLDVQEKKQALRWIDKSGLKSSFVETLRRLTQQTKPVMVKSGRWEIYFGQVKHRLTAWIEKQGLAKTIMVYQLLQLVLVIPALFMVGLVTENNGSLSFSLEIGFFGWGLMVSLVLALFLIFVSFSEVGRGQRVRAYRFLRYSLFDGLFLVTFFAFYFYQLYGIVELAVSLAYMEIFNLVMFREKRASFDN